MIHGDISDEEGDDPQSKVVAWGGDEDLDDALEVGGWSWSEGGSCEG